MWKLLKIFDLLLNAVAVGINFLEAASGVDFSKVRSPFREEKKK